MVESSILDLIIAQVLSVTTAMITMSFLGNFAGKLLKNQSWSLVI